MRLEELIRGIDGVRLVGGDAGTRICDLTEDSRTAVPGSLFVARGGLKADGRAFVRDAIALGAVAVLTDAEGAASVPSGAATLVAPDVPLAAARLAERFYGEPTGRLVLIGVTGTNGKTTVAHLVHQILNHAGLRCGLVGTVEVDDGHSVAPAAMTTPPAIELSRTFGCMVEAGCRAAVMEVSSHALMQRRAAALRFDVGVFTNLSGDHLDYHGTMEAYAAAKGELFRMLPPDGLAVLNAEDPWSEEVGGEGRTRARRVRCAEGAGAEAEWRIEPVGAATAGSGAGRGMSGAGGVGGVGQHVRLSGPVGGPGDAAGVHAEAWFSLPGRHNRMNLLQAAAAACEALRLADRPAPVIERLLRSAIPELRPPRGRLELVGSGAPGDEPALVFVDFAHTDDGLRKALEALRPLVAPDASLWAVFGAGGNKDATKRPRMGRAAAELADRVVVTSDNPRREPPHEIVSQIIAGIPEPDRDRVIVQVDRSRAIRAAVLGAAEAYAARRAASDDPATVSRDVVLIAGKGHETEQIVCGAGGHLVSRRFVDQEEAAAALAEARAAVEGEPGRSGRPTPPPVVVVAGEAAEERA